MRHLLLLLLVVLLVSPTAAGAQFELIDKTVVTCDSIILTKEVPMVLVIAKTGDSSRTYKSSQIDIDGLPDDLRKEFLDYQAAQLTKRMILHNDKWVHRDEVLLEADPRYKFDRPLAKIGDSVIEFDNTLDETVTIGMRSATSGYEMHIEKGRKKNYQVPDGTVWYLLVYESPDGTQLIVQKAKPVALKRTRLTVTILPSGDDSQDEMGVIPIPKEYQVAP